MSKNKILVLSDLREFTEIVAQKAIYLANKYEKEIDVLHVEDESFLKFFKEKTECSLDKSKAILKSIYKDKANIFCKCGNFIEIVKEHIEKNNISTVIVIKTEDEPNYKNILVPTDLSKASKINIEYLVSIFPEANFHIEHYYKAFFEDRVKLYGFDDDEAHDFVDFYADEAQKDLDNFIKSLEIPSEIKIFKKAKKYVNIKSMIDESIEYKRIDLLGLSVGSSLSIFSFDLLEDSKKDVIIYKVKGD